jgi:ketosteroid isomerase-like protein
MKHFLVALAWLSVLPALHASAQINAAGKTEKSAAAIHAASGGLEKEILDLERKRIAAMVSKDVAALDALLADDLSYTHSGGTTDTKSSFITLIKERGRYLGVDYSDTQVIPWGDNTVVVRGRAQIRLEGTPSYPVLFLDVWALRNGSWKMVAWQATRIPG